MKETNRDINVEWDKVLRGIWNRGIKLFWYRLWVRKNEFHRSLDIDYDAIYDMDEEQKQKYFLNIIKRRDIAHKRDK